jgi:hypothetical protein
MIGAAERGDDAASTRGAAAPPLRKSKAIERDARSALACPMEIVAKLWLIVLILVAISIPLAAMLGWL